MDPQKKPKLVLAEVEGVLKRKNGGKDTEDVSPTIDEEETQISCSMPWYFEHIFGSLVGGSQVLSQGPLSPRPVVQHSDSHAVPVLESQGFLVESAATAKHNEHSIHTHACRSVSLSSGSNSPSPVPISTSDIACGSQNSMLLFASPEFSPPCLNRTQLQLSNQFSDGHSKVKSALECVKGVSTEMAVEGHGKESMKTSKVALTKSRKRKRSRMEDKVAAYHCPPSCTPLAQCVNSDRTVDLLVMVLQGVCM